jgi:hypothetical protein
VKTLRRICTAMILSLSLAGSVLAGQIETTGAVAPTTPLVVATPTSPTVISIVLTIVGATY